MAGPTYPLEVLIVEDEEPFRKVLSVVLREKGGYVVEECESGEEAIEALRASPRDIVLLDYRMEPVSGLNVLQWMLEQKMETPVIVLTGAGSEHVAVEAMKLGAYDYIRKDNFEPQHLPVIVNSVHERHLFKKEREGNARNSVDRERNLVSLELLRNGISLSSNLISTTLANIAKDIDRFHQNLRPLIGDQGQELLNTMAEELKQEYNFMSTIIRSLSDLSDIMYQKFKGLQDPQSIEEALKAQLRSLQDRSSSRKK